MGVARGCPFGSPPPLRGSFLKRLQGRLVLPIVPRPDGDVAEVQPVQKLADGPLVVDHAPALGDQRLQVGAAPARQVAQASRSGSCLDDPVQLGLLLRRQPPRVARRGPVHQARRPLGVEPVHPVAQCLAVHAADPRRVRTAHPFVDRSDRQQPTRLIRIISIPRHRRTPAASKSSRNTIDPIRPLLYQQGA